MGFVTRDGMRSNRALSAYIEKNKTELAGLLEREKKDGRHRDRIEHIETLLPRAQIEYWSRFNTPLLCLIFVFLGLGLGVKGGRGRERNASVLGLGLAVAYYALFFAGISMAKSGLVPASVAIFLPTTLMGLVAFKYYREVDWQT